MDYFNDCVFVGDSIIKSLSGYLILDESAVIAKIGISPRKILDTPFNTYYGNMTALEALQKTNANKIYILLGSNSLDSSSSSEDEKILKYYGEFLDSIQTTLPNTTLYVISITPVTDHCKYKLNNERITKFNTKLYSLCTQRGVYYVDAYSQWFDEDGQLLKEYYEPDGLHLRHNGCDKLLDILLENTAQ
jgi:lysophospholipase L1-like esterase